MTRVSSGFAGVRCPTVRCARERGGRPDPTSLGSGLPPRSGFHGAREGVPAACPRRESNPAPSQRRKQRRYRWGLGRVREGKDLGAPVGPCGGSWGTVRRTGPGSGSSDHSSEPSVSAGAFAARRRDAISRPAPPPTATSTARTIGTMPAPVMASGLGR